MTRHAYRGRRFFTTIALPHAILLAALTLSFVTNGLLAIALGVAVPVVLLYELVTLHIPHAVAVDDEGVTFFAYGRGHRYRWRDARVSVRKFLIQDRVLVRMLPTKAWRGRYWIFETIDGYPALLKEMERRAAR